MENKLTLILVTEIILYGIFLGVFLKKLQINSLDYKLKKWQKILELNDHLIYIIEEPNQNKMKWGKEINEDKFVGGDVSISEQKVDYIRIYYNEEYVLVHELLHIKYPELSEKEIIKLTKEIYE